MNLDELWVPCTWLLLVMGFGILIHNLDRIRDVKTTLIFMSCWAVPLFTVHIYQIVVAIMSIFH